MPTDRPTVEHVDLDLPLHPRHASTVRVVASSVAADAGFSIDEIDDLRLGVNEAVSVLADVDPGAGRLHLRFDLGDGIVVMTARRVGDVAPLAIDGLDVLATKILRAVVDEFDIDESGAFTVVKRVAGDAPR